MTLVVNFRKEKYPVEGNITSEQILNNPDVLKENYAYSLVICNSEHTTCLSSDVEQALKSSDFESYLLIYRGILKGKELEKIENCETFDDLEERQIGFYLNEDKDHIIITNDVYEDFISFTEFDVIKSDITDTDELINLLINTVPDSAKLESIRKANMQRSDEEILRYEIKDEDTPLVATVKEYINSIELYTSTVNEKLDSGDAWNLIYGLRRRSSMTWDYFEKWMYVLDAEVELSIVPKK